MNRIPRSWIAGVVALVVTALVAHGRQTPYNNFVLLADALLNGHAWINWPGAYIDALLYVDKRYIIEAPMPALLLMPFVKLFGTGVNQTWLSIALCGVSIGAAWELFERYGLRPFGNLAMCAMLLAGTDLLWCAMLGDVWFIAHVSSVCFTMLALCELAGKRRGWLVAIWAACAVESRFTMVLVLPVYAWMLLGQDWKRRIGTFVAGLVPFATFWVAYNQARWGTWYDIGYTAWYHQDGAGSPVGSPFQLRYFGYQVWSFFQQGLRRSAAFPFYSLDPGVSGNALTWTSPALVAAFLARKPEKTTIALWICVLLTAAPNFVYYVNGFAQFGMRHALDFEPFLIALAALGIRDRLPGWVCVLVAYSCAVGLWGCWYWNTVLRHGS